MPMVYSAPPRFGDSVTREMRVRLRHEHVAGLVVDAAGRTQTQHVPVVDERRLADWKHEDPRFTGALDDAQRVNVGGVLDPRREAPRTAQAEAAGLRDSGTRPRALAGNHGQPFAAEQFGDRFVAKVGRAGADRERRRHQHPPGGRVPVGNALDDAKRRDWIELGTAADRPRHPHAEQPLAVQRLDDGSRQLSLPIAVFRVFIRDGRDPVRAGEQVSGRFDTLWCSSFRLPRASVSCQRVWC